MSFINYLLDEKNQHQVGILFLEHIELTLIAVAGAILLGVPLGILISYHKKLSRPIMGAVNLIQAIPSLALLGAAIPLLGIGALPAVIVVLLYSLLPITKNTYTGISNISPETIECAQGIGMTGFQVLTKVQIPLALPVIMAGVRISAVTAVGLMTIAAFIGAGGLGFLVFSGISTVNNNLILAGALPACILALLVDYIAGKIEEAATPGTSDSDINKSNNRARRRQLILGTAAILLVALIGYYSYSTLNSNKDSVIVAGRDFTEQDILTHLVAELIERKTDIKVERKPHLGGTQVTFSALKKGDLDLYVEYTGAVYANILHHPPIADMEKVYQTVQTELKDKFNILVLPQMQFNNTYTLSTTREIAEQYGLKKISDLKNVAQKLSTALTFEFMNRTDGLPGLEQNYGFSFATNKAINGSQRYLALAGGSAQIIDAFSTDGLLKKFNLVSLEDDKNYFPPYYAIPIIRQEVAKRHPEILPLLENLGQYLTNPVMIDLNYRVDELQQDPQQVARDFLQEKGLI